MSITVWCALNESRLKGSFQGIQNKTRGGRPQRKTKATYWQKKADRNKDDKSRSEWMNKWKKIFTKGMIGTEMEKEILPRCVYPAVSHRLTLHCWCHWILCLCYCFETTLMLKLALKICFAYKLQGIMSSFEHSSAIAFRKALTGNSDHAMSRKANR